MNVIHKSESAEPLELFNPKRWDVVNEGELTLNKPTKASLAIRNSDAYYWNGPYEGGWGNFDIPKFKADVAAGKRIY
jgi:hypothetical protein